MVFEVVANFLEEAFHYVNLKYFCSGSEEFLDGIGEISGELEGGPGNDTLTIDADPGEDLDVDVEIEGGPGDDTISEDELECSFDE